MPQLDGKKALIAGASSGMGRATALRFAREGADLALLARRADELRAVATEVERLGRRAVVLPVDLTDRAGVQRVVERAESELGRVDVAVHAAGTNLPRRALEVLDPADWDMMVQVNLTAAYNVTRALLPGMRR